MIPFYVASKLKQGDTSQPSQTPCGFTCEPQFAAVFSATPAAVLSATELASFVGRRSATDCCWRISHTQLLMQRFGGVVIVIYAPKQCDFISFSFELLPAKNKPHSAS